MTPVSATFTESEVEDAALEWLEGLRWQVAHGPHIAPDAAGSERRDYSEVVLGRRLRDALERLNAALPGEAVEDAFRKLAQPEGSTLEARNRAFHRMLVDGVTVECRTAGGVLRGAQVAVLDYDDPINNDWLAVNQLTVVDGEHERRPDVVLFVNGLPLGLIELKNPADEKATVWSAWNQIQTYKAELTNLFAFNAALIASDGVEARMGTLTAGREWFKPWRTIGGETLAAPHLPQLQVMLEGMCERGPVPDVGPGLHRVRGRRQRRAVQEDGRVSPVPRRGSSGLRDAASDSVTTGGRRSKRIRASESLLEHPVAIPAIGASASSGTPKAPARASPWPSTPGASSASRRWRTRLSSC